MEITQGDVDQLVCEMTRGFQAWINGQLERAGTDAMEQSADMSIFGPFGGDLVRNGPEFAESQPLIAARFRSGTGTCELQSAMISGDLVVLVMIERAEVLFEGRAQAQRWALRTTQVLRRSGSRWLRLHRHADPLVRRRGFDETLALAAG